MADESPDTHYTGVLDHTGESFDSPALQSFMERNQPLTNVASVVDQALDFSPGSLASQEWLKNYKLQQQPQIKNPAPILDEIISPLKKPDPNQLYPSPNEMTSRPDQVPDNTPDLSHTAGDLEESEDAEDKSIPGVGAPGLSRGGLHKGLQGIADMLTPQTEDHQAGLKAAQQARDQQILMGELGKAGIQIGSSIARVAPQKTDILDTMIKNAGDIVTDYDAKVALEKKDPNSDYSKGLQKYLKSMYGITTNASGEAIAGTMLKPIETMYENQQKALHHSEDLAMKNKELKQQKDLALEAKKQKDMDTANSKTIAMLESARGSPAVGQAEKDMYAVSKVNSMVNLYGDPNKLNPAQVQLLATEVAKIAQGGVPTAVELRGLNPSSLPSVLAEYAQKVVNHPVSANLGPFVKSMQDYTNSLKKDAQKVIQDKYGRVIESSRKQLGDDHYDVLKAHYLDRFKEASENVKMQGPDGKVRLIPNDQIDAAKAAGGVVVQ